jgi:hypothetical protein
MDAAHHLATCRSVSQRHGQAAIMAIESSHHECETTTALADSKEIRSEEHTAVMFRMGCGSRCEYDEGGRAGEANELLRSSIIIIFFLATNRNFIWRAEILGDVGGRKYDRRHSRTYFSTQYSSSINGSCNAY